MKSVIKDHGAVWKEKIVSVEKSVLELMHLQHNGITTHASTPEIAIRW